MKLLTHNVLQCNVKGCGSADGGPGYPLKVSSMSIAVRERDPEDSDDDDFDAEFVRGLLGRLHWPAVASAAESIGLAVPEDAAVAVTSPETVSENLLRSIHAILFDHDLLEGSLSCPKCSRIYPISQGIVNMLPREEEI